MLGEKMNEYITANDLKYCPDCDTNVLGVTGLHERCCWCGGELVKISELGENSE